MCHAENLTSTELLGRWVKQRYKASLGTWTSSQGPPKNIQKVLLCVRKWCFFWKKCSSFFWGGPPSKSVSVPPETPKQHKNDQSLVGEMIWSHRFWPFLELKRSLSGDSECLKALGFSLHQTAMVPPVRSRYAQVELKETRVENFKLWLVGFL